MSSSILTANEFIAQGTTAGAIMSIAALHRGAVADELRNTARTVAAITGQSLQIPGAVTAEREAARLRRRAVANDNRRRGYRRAA